jgi:hypothetical protein
VQLIILLGLKNKMRLLNLSRTGAIVNSIFFNYDATITGKKIPTVSSSPLKSASLTVTSSASSILAVAKMMASGVLIFGFACKLLPEVRFPYPFEL